MDENNWIRSWSHETYLWYNELPDIDPKSNADPISYFNGMKTNTKTSNGMPKDRFHFTMDTNELKLLSGSGISVGFGASVKRDGTNSRLLVTYTEPNSPARNANIIRGTEIIAINGIYSDEDIDAVEKAIFPEFEGESHNFIVRKPNSEANENVTLFSAKTTEIPVHIVETLKSNNLNIGYLMLNSFGIKTAEDQLINAVNSLKSAGVTELILDLRYNGGGYLGISGVLGTMIAGNKASGEIFENMVYNDKHTQYDPFFSYLIEPLIFPETTLGFSTKEVTPLPKLNLSRVFIISTNDTASASEALINSLRGIDVEVILIGETTHGKPYGFHGRDNCGTTYFTIQFKGLNAKGYGDYTDGFKPSEYDNKKDKVRGCPVYDDLAHPLGDENERMLATARYFIKNNECPVFADNLLSKPEHPLSNVQGKIVSKSPATGLLLR